MKKTIVAFGDSNTHGYCSQTGGRFSEEERWTCLLEKYLGGEYRVMEEGLSGRTTVFEDPLFEGLSGLSAISPCLLTHEPVDLLIIMLGTNDTKEMCIRDSIHRKEAAYRLFQLLIPIDADSRRQLTVMGPVLSVKIGIPFHHTGTYIPKPASRFIIKINTVLILVFQKHGTAVLFRQLDQKGRFLTGEGA